jgi:hypothetical protein
VVRLAFKERIKDPVHKQSALEAVKYFNIRNELQNWIGVLFVHRDRLHEPQIVLLHVEENKGEAKEIFLGCRLHLPVQARAL